MREEQIGIFEFGEVVNVGDPCCERDNVNRICDMSIVPGEYYCYVTYEDDRVQSVGIRLKSFFDQFVGELEMNNEMGVGVFSGVTGFFKERPDYTEEGWYRFCDTIKDNQGWIDADGFYVSTDKMEGAYPVFVHRNENGKADAIDVQFFSPDFTEE